MPAVYAHRRFGAEVLACCRNGAARAAIGAFHTLYEVGLQGPDVLFYYDPLHKNPCKDAGSALHDAPAAPFFARGAEKVLRPAAGAPAGQALLSYLLGFSCHYALDSACHSYIEWEIARSGHSHVSIETAFEAALMEADGVDWRSHNPAGYIPADETTARTIARVLPASPAALRRCLWNMKATNALLMPGCPARTALVEGAVRAAGKWEAIGGLIPDALDRPAYAGSCAELERLYEEAIPTALALMDGLCAHVQEGAALPDAFGYTYGPRAELMAGYEAAAQS